MARREPDYRVFVSRNIVKEGEEPSNFYTDVGAAWNVDKDGISISLNALPAALSHAAPVEFLCGD